MNKRTLILTAAAILALGAIGAAVFAATRPEDKQAGQPENTESMLTSNRYAEARTSPTNGIKCLEEDASIAITAEERTDIEYASMAHIYDVPAGTELDVLLATYSENRVTGSNLYEDGYGNYNFVLSKQDGDWTVTEYRRCEI